jgi:hypothetical protein
LNGLCARSRPTQEASLAKIDPDNAKCTRVQMIIVHKCPEVSVQASLGEHDQVIQALATNRWTAQQMREAFPWDSAPRYLLRDRDRIFGHCQDFVKQVKAMGDSLAPRRLAATAS